MSSQGRGSFLRCSSIFISRSSGMPACSSRPPEVHPHPLAGHAFELLGREMHGDAHLLQPRHETVVIRVPVGDQDPRDL